MGGKHQLGTDRKQDSLEKLHLEPKAWFEDSDENPHQTKPDSSAKPGRKRYLLKKSTPGMGDSKHETSPLREVGARPAGKTILFPDTPHPGQAGHYEDELLRMV